MDDFALYFPQWQLEHKHNKFEIYRTNIKGGCQSGRKVVTHNSMSDLPLVGNGKNVKS